MNDPETTKDDTPPSETTVAIPLEAAELLARYRVYNSGIYLRRFNVATAHFAPGPKSTADDLESALDAVYRALQERHHA